VTVDDRCTRPAPNLQVDVGRRCHGCGQRCGQLCRQVTTVHPQLAVGHGRPDEAADPLQRGCSADSPARQAFDRPTGSTAFHVLSGPFPLSRYSY
jgi:hypothetical protein